MRLKTREQSGNRCTDQGTEFGLAAMPFLHCVAWISYV